LTGEGFVDLGFARVDIAREARQGAPEAVYAPGKQPSEIVAIVRQLLANNSGCVLVTRVDPALADWARAKVPGGHYDPEARLLVWRPAPPTRFRLVVASAGTADRPVAAEAVAVARAVGLDVDLHADVGVAGIHRILSVTGQLTRADAVVVIAGMEGALASVVAGLVACPVIAVPTSTGYGAALQGVTALLAMLSSCAPGVTVVNIDSGYAAAMAAYRLARVLGRAA